jgi:beta-D-xylosidase 4
MSLRLAALALLSCTSAHAQTVPANTVTYDTRACQPPHDTYPFCNSALSLDERVNDLIERIWAVSNETIPLLLTARSMGKNNISALGLPEFDYGMNAIHGVQSSCVSDAAGTHCPTSFMNPVGFGNSWNKSSVFELGRTVGLEGRALWLAGAVEQGPRNHIGLE